MVKTSDAHNGQVQFIGRYAGEKCHFYFRQHWIRMVPTLLQTLFWLLLFGLAIATASTWLPEQTAVRRLTVVFLITIFTGTQLLLLVKFYRYFLYIIVLTDRKIHRIKKTLVTIDDHQSIDLWMLQDTIKQQHGPVQNLLGFGTLILEAQDTVFQIHFVPGISAKYTEVARLVGEARRLGGAAARPRM